MSFKPPDSFIQASVARQEKLKQKRDEEEPNFKSRNLKPLESPPTRPLISVSPSSYGSPSKAVLEVEKLRLQREERRLKQVEIRKQRDGLDEHDQKTLYYRNIIDDFRAQFLEKRGSINRTEKHGGSRFNIKVCVRKRPLNPKELGERAFDIITAATDCFPYAHVYLHEPRSRVDMTQEINTHRFVFDNVFDETSSNSNVYQEAVKPLISSFFNGNRVNLFAYGQTGSGKSHTIFGSPQNPGVYEYACRDIFEMLSSEECASVDFELCISFFELYRSKVYDLLSNRHRVDILEDARGNVQLYGHSEVSVHSFAEMMQTIQIGMSLRSTGATEANSQSSRSHAIIQMTLRLPDSPNYGKFLLIDLAGSERGDERSLGLVDRETRLEGAEINKSLLALKECIRAIHKQHQGTQANHIPFRGSKLTQILRDSLVGRGTQTVMMAMLNPASSSTDHSLNTLRYADRVKELRRKQSPTTETLPSEEQVDSPEFDMEDILDMDIQDDQMYEGEYDEEEAEYPQDDSFEPPEFDLAVEREGLVSMHYDLVPLSAKLAKEERDLLRALDSPEFDIQTYVSGMKSIMDSRFDMWSRYKSRLDAFSSMFPRD